MHQKNIEKLLHSTFKPVYLSIINESHLHRSAKGNASHFKVIIVSEQFSQMGLLQRHRAIYTVLKQQLQEHIHALALHAFTPKEWQLKNQTVAVSPHCRGLN